MTGYYNNFHQGNLPRGILPCATSDPLDHFLNPTSSKSQVPCAKNPPDLITASSSDSSSVGEDSRDMKHVSSTTDYSTALVPYQVTPHQPVSQQLVPSTTSPVSATNTPQHKLIQVPRSHNPFGADAIHPQKNKMKKQRKGKTAAGAVGGMVVGGLALGPAGVFLGAAAGAVATNKICKARERRAQRKYEQESFQRAAENSRVHAATFA